MVVAVRVLCRSVVFVICRLGLLFFFLSRLLCFGSCVLFLLSRVLPFFFFLLYPLMRSVLVILLEFSVSCFRVSTMKVLCTRKMQKMQLQLRCLYHYTIFCAVFFFGSWVGDIRMLYFSSRCVDEFTRKQ